MRKLVHLAVSAAVGAIALTAAAGAARADQVHYVGIHPIVKAYGHGTCYIEVPHVHVYEPQHAATMYREVEDHYHFVGDPVAYDYDGDTYAYYGHHPIAVDVVVGEPREEHYIEHCYLDGPHYHAYQPPAELSFELKGDAYWYVGTWEPAYEVERPRYAGINAVYAEVTYTRPVVTVTPPAAFAGVYIEAPVVRAKVKNGKVKVKGPPGHGHGHVHGGVEIRGGVEVHVPAPSVEVRLGVGGVSVGGGHHHHHKHKKHKKRGKRGKRH